MSTLSKTKTNLLRFVSGGNAKLARWITTVSLPTGYTCPGAHLCKAHFNTTKNQVIDSPNQDYRCYAVQAEAMYKNVRDLRHHNLKLLLAAQREDPVNGMFKLILASIEPRTAYIRLHQAGDFFVQAYWDAWLRVMDARPDIKFYAYTKSMLIAHDWIVVRGLPLPDNFQLTLSDGSTRDDLMSVIQAYDARIGVAYMVDHPDKAAAMGLPIDHTDEHAMAGGHDFSLLLHGSQPKDTPAAKSIKRMKDEGVKFSYSSP